MDTKWRHRAACRGKDTERFFPVGNKGPALKQIAEAKAVCGHCPVRSECLAWALESGQDAGIWGGMSEDERRALKRRNARQSPAPVKTSIGADDELADREGSEALSDAELLRDAGREATEAINNGDLLAKPAPRSHLLNLRGEEGQAA